MNTVIPAALHREDLRRRMHLQRQTLARQLYPEAVLVSPFPRSMTMRLLQGQTGLLLWLLGELAPPLLRYFVEVRHERRCGTWIKAQEAGNRK